MIRYALMAVGGFILGLIVSQQFCSKIPVEKIVTKEVITNKIDTLYYPYIVEIESNKTSAPKKDTTAKKDSIVYETKTVYKDKEIIIKDYYPVIDSNCVKQLDSIKRTIVIKGIDTSLIKTNLKETEVIIHKTEPKYKRVYLGSGITFDNVTKDFNFKYNLDYQFKNKVVIGIEGILPFKNTDYIPKKYGINARIPLLKFK